MDLELNISAADDQEDKQEDYEKKIIDGLRAVCEKIVHKVAYIEKDVPSTEWSSKHTSFAISAHMDQVTKILFRLSMGLLSNLWCPPGMCDACMHALQKLMVILIILWLPQL